MSLHDRHFKPFKTHLHFPLSAAWYKIQSWPKALGSSEAQVQEIDPASKSLESTQQSRKRRQLEEGSGCFRWRWSVWIVPAPEVGSYHGSHLDEGHLSFMSSKTVDGQGSTHRKPTDVVGMPGEEALGLSH